MRVLLALLITLVAGPVAAIEWPIDLPLDPARRQDLALGEHRLVAGQQLQVEADWQQLPQLVWLELCLLTSDERYYASAIPLPAAPDRRQPLLIPVAPDSWGGPDGPLDADALLGVHTIWIRIHGVPALDGQLRGRLRVLDPVASEGERQVQVLHGGTVAYGDWRELRLRLLGPELDEDATVDVVLADGRRIPCFLHRRLAPHLGRLRVRGPSLWVARLRSDEVPTSGWRVTADDWLSAALPAVPLSAVELPLPAIEPLPVASPGRNDHLLVMEQDGRALRREVAAKPALAPQLSWRADWSGYRGADAIAHQAAARLDLALAAGTAAVDLLPQSLFEEQGTFRFGLSPWHQDQGGPWRWPQDLFRSEAPIGELVAHARSVIARCRAARQLEQWRISCQVAANDPSQRARLARIVDELRELLATDPRPLVIEHPQAVPYDQRRVDQQPWLDFELDTEGFHSLAGELRRSEEAPSSGRFRLEVALAAADQGPAVHLLRVLDANVFNLDRLEFDALLDGDGGLQLYAWVTDDQHRWYQQRLVFLRGGAPWRSVGVDFSDHAAWEPVGHDAAWTGQQRRRLRRLGIMGFAHERSAPGSLAIDRALRFGWPAEPEPELHLLGVAPSATRLACFEALDVDFDLDLRSQNPYDPDYADVSGEVEGPDGQRLIHPAYWYEGVDLVETDGRETPQHTDTAGWRWHFSPPRPGEWKWRLHARIKYRDRWVTTHGEWRTLSVQPADADALLPVRASADPRYFEHSDGSWFYPIGMNLRSPGDTRQDEALADAGSDRRSLDFERRGTRSFAHWFEQMQANGMNYARVWMSPWWCGLEWTREWDGFGGLTSYNQLHAAQLDRVMDLAREHRVYVQLELQNHGMTAPNVDSQWQDNPYNHILGGPCRKAADFFTNPAAWAAHEKRLRYTVARWGHHSHLMCWVLSSEMEFTGAWWDEAFRHDAGHSASTERWIRRSLEWLREHDHSGRLASVHFSHPWRAGKLWREVETLGFNYSNAYSGFEQIAGPQQRIDTALAVYLNQKFPPWTLQRPTMIGEWGGHWMETSHAVLAAELRAGVWIQAVLPYGGNTGFWWWLWVDATDSWGDYAAVARFTAGEDPRGKDYRSQSPTVDDQVRMIGMAGADEHRYYAWRAGSSRDPALPALEDAGLARIRTGQAGSRWHVQRHDCSNGEAEAEAILQADASGDLLLPLGRLAPDTAFKLSRSSKPAVTEVPWAVP